MSSDDDSQSGLDESLTASSDARVSTFSKYSEPTSPQLKIVGDRNFIVFGNVVEAGREELLTSLTLNNESQLLGTLITEEAQVPQENYTSELCEDAIIEQLQRHPPESVIITEALRKLADLSKNLQASRFDLVKLVIDVMSRCPKELLVQRASLSCLVQLKTQLSHEEFGIQLCIILRGTLNAIQNFQMDKTLFESALMLLNDRKLRRCFRYQTELCIKCCIRLIEGLDFPGKNIRQIALNLFVYLLDFMPSTDLEEIGYNNIYRNKLFMILKKRNEDEECDDLLIMALDICTHLSQFLVVQYAILQESWLSLLQSMLTKFSRVDVRQKVLCIIEYVSRLNDAVSDIKRPEFVKQLMDYIDCNDINVSFPSALILARAIKSTSDEIIIATALSSIKSAVEKWESPDEELTKYYSLTPICTLLNANECEEIQLLASWTINHLCSSTNSKFYIKQLYTDNLVHIIIHLSKLPSTAPTVAYILDNLLKIVGQFVNENHTDVDVSNTSNDTHSRTPLVIIKPINVTLPMLFQSYRWTFNNMLTQLPQDLQEILFGRVPVDS